MSDLISLAQVAENFGLQENTVAEWVKAAKLKSSRLMIGADPITLFDQKEAVEVVQSHIDKAKAEADQKKAAEEAAREPTMKELMDKLKSIAIDISDVAELQEEIKRLTAANHGIFKALTEFKAETQDRLAGLKTIVIGARDEVHAMKNVKQAVEKLAEPATLKSVAVIGISKVHHAKLQLDYGTKIDLKLIDPADIKGIYAVRNKVWPTANQTIYAMRKYTDVRHADQMKSAKISPTYIEGGLEALEDALDTHLANTK
jgi:uncharacterized protein YqfB (UPF0267 family)